MTNTTQKPSERIRELLGSDWALSSVAAIVQYLDEQAAAANPASLQVPLTAEDLTKRVWHQPEKAPQAEEAPADVFRSLSPEELEKLHPIDESEIREALANGTAERESVITGRPVRYPEPAGIIRAAEGVTLEPGEYIDIENSIRFSARKPHTAEREPRFGIWTWFVDYGITGFVTAVRRVEPAPVTMSESSGSSVPNHYDSSPATVEPFPAGTPEAIRDALLRRHIFDCVENAGPKAAWHYLHALEIITGYRLELTKERDELRSKVSELEEQRKREMYAWKLDCDRLTECRYQLSARDSEIARLREELHVAYRKGQESVVGGLGIDRRMENPYPAPAAPATGSEP